MMACGVGGRKHGAHRRVRKHSAQTKTIRTTARGNKVKQSKHAQGDHYTWCFNTVLRLAQFVKFAAIPRIETGSRTTWMKPIYTAQKTYIDRTYFQYPNMYCISLPRCFPPQWNAFSSILLWFDLTAVFAEKAGKRTTQTSPVLKGSNIQVSGLFVMCIWCQW